MAVFSTNQNHQLYVAKNLVADGESVKEVGDISQIQSVGEQSTTGDCAKELFFEYMGAETPMRSDLIPVKNITYLKLKKAEDMQEKLKKVVVTLDSDIHDDGNPISGQDYVLRIAFRQFYGMSDEDQYFKFGAVHAVKGMTAEQFYKKMAESLERNFSRELGTYLKFTGDATGLTIEEVEQPWHLGTMAQERVYFEIYPTTIYVDGDEAIWGVTQETGRVKNSKGEDVTDCGEAGTVKNGKKIADLEYFCMGERGDYYRMKGWPNVVPTTYLVDASKEYDVLEIHFAFTDTGAESYRSEKDISIVAEAGGDILSTLESEIKEKANIA